MLNIPQIVEIIFNILILLGAIVFHEYAHGWVAFKCGDRTAKLAGRLTLNPIKHIDPVGTVILPIALYTFFRMPFGWARPVPINFNNLQNPRRDIMLVAIAGPAINILGALLFGQLTNLNVSPAAQIWLVRIVGINCFLAAFNLIPIPPLDGSRIALGLLPRQLAELYSRLEPWGFMLIIVLAHLKYLDFVHEIAMYLTNYFVHYNGVIKFI